MNHAQIRDERIRLFETGKIELRKAGAVCRMSAKDPADQSIADRYNELAAMKAVDE